MRFASDETSALIQSLSIGTVCGRVQSASDLGHNPVRETARQPKLLSPAFWHTYVRLIQQRTQATDRCNRYPVFPRSGRRASQQNALDNSILVGGHWRRQSGTIGQEPDGSGAADADAQTGQALKLGTIYSPLSSLEHGQGDHKSQHDEWNEPKLNGLLYVIRGKSPEYPWQEQKGAPVYGFQHCGTSSSHLAEQAKAIL
jgi:hypothetical protein